MSFYQRGPGSTSRLRKHLLKSLFTEAQQMDLQTATRLNGSEGRISRVLALICLGVACGLLAVTLSDAGGASANAPATVEHAAR
jgi:hypothetical protein